MCILALVANKFYSQREDKTYDGVELSVEVVDKDTYMVSTTVSGDIVHTKRYQLKAYVNEELREIHVSKQQYDHIDIDDTIRVILNDNTLMILDK